MSLAFLRENDMEKAPYLPYSFKLISSDFSLFDCAKYLLPGTEFPDQQTLLAAVKSICQVEKK
jgi:hypothetical protein